MLRAAVKAGTPWGWPRRRSWTAALVSDDIIIGLVKERIAEPDCAQGFLFDGFPRTIPQADAMKSAGVKLDVVLEIDVPDAAIIERMSGRVPAPGRTYHVSSTRRRRWARTTSPARTWCSADDKEETVRKRLQVYQVADPPAGRLLLRLGGHRRRAGAALPAHRRHRQRGAADHRARLRGAGLSLRT